MGKHKKHGKQNQNQANNQKNHVHSHETTNNNIRSDYFILFRFFKIRIHLTLRQTVAGIICLLAAIYISVIGYLETRVNTPFDFEKVVRDTGLAVPDRYWGTYRPGVYMGMKSREPHSPVFGLMWYELTGSHKGIRHWCDQNDNLPTYGWLHHDGVSFGNQLISDPPHIITTSFVKPAQDDPTRWTVRINVTTQNKIKSPLMLIWYGALDEPYGPMETDSRLWAERGAIHGYTDMHGNFTVKTHTIYGRVLHESYTEAHAAGLHVLKEKFYSLLKVEKHPDFGRLAVLGPDDALNEKDKEVNFVPIQLLIEPPYIVDIVYASGQTKRPIFKGEEYTLKLNEKIKNFEQEFEEKLNLSGKGYSNVDISVGRAGLSNMLGGVGYMWGAGRVQSPHTRGPVPYWKAPLYTAVPSRSFFPRGFLWDEGFHGLLIGRWSPAIMMDIAAHWMDLVNVEGWIPREQILGSEALARVPKEFVVQSNAAANPPMLLITIGTMVRTRPDLFAPYGPHRATLHRMYTRLQAWYNWFLTTQRGDEPTSFRWQGREDDGLQLNPKSLSSGLDDYPRASHPSSIERHVDLRCWMFAAAEALSNIAQAVNSDPTKFEEIKYQLSDEDLLNKLHWSETSQTYADYGLHTDSVRLVRTKPKNPNEQAKVVRSVGTTPQPKLVTSAFGYVSLFPMLLKVLKPNSEKLGIILDSLDRPDLLWSPYGLRSLSKSSPYYMKRNTEHDPPYWRGQIWLNVNYLALSALRHYANSDSVYAIRAGELHDKLRDNVVRNVISEYKRTGYLWEQYSGEDGRGSGCKPFTGWTALFVLIMAEEY